MDTHQIISALVDGLGNPSTRPHGLASVRYPMRELQPKLLSDGALQVKLSRIGYEYKRRYPKPKEPHPVSINEVTDMVTAVLPQYVVVKMDVNQKDVIITIKEVAKNDGEAK